ncbi:hypothetical protein [Gluconacetobacter tumulicola]|uniref:Uncharacterized protein n=1 Tax=Gluconacetobacter tumulicola TaxID=1017177 RepID=A0A7W4JH48_9PROT|nr:hypothetical protein [Gluconacetobacter tumulicola]MBB2181116.1 hypothetical protein [Gluconacetobacter tumulicola]
MITRNRPASGPGKQAYEARRAAKAGISLDRWLARKEAARKAASPPAAQPNPVLAQARSVWRRLIERAHRPL